MIDNAKRLDEKKWQDFGKNLLQKKGSEKQREFLLALQNGKDSFLDYIEQHLPSADIGDYQVPFDAEFSESEFRHPPRDTQEIIWKNFEHVPDETKHYCGFWGYTIIQMLKGDCIKPSYLASELNGVSDNSDKGGAYIIDKVLKSHPTEEKEMDRCVRRALRSMCNPAPRGKRIVFNDFYLGKSYWRWHWAKKMSDFLDERHERILKILDESYYADFSAKMHSGKSYISSEKTLGGLLLYLGEPNRKKLTAKQLGKLIDKISYISAWKAIEMQEPHHTQAEIQQLSENL